jgi:hypothetical protein
LDEIERGFVENESDGKKMVHGQGVGVGAEKRCGKNGLVVWPFFWRDLRVVRKSRKKLSKNRSTNLCSLPVLLLGSSFDDCFVSPAVTNFAKYQKVVTQSRQVLSSHGHFGDPAKEIFSESPLVGFWT